MPSEGPGIHVLDRWTHRQITHARKIKINLKRRKILFFYLKTCFILCMGIFPACMFLYYVQAVPVEARKGCWISGTVVVGMSHYAGRAASALNCVAKSQILVFTLYSQAFFGSFIWLFHFFSCQWYILLCDTITQFSYLNYCIFTILLVLYMYVCICVYILIFMCMYVSDCGGTYKQHLPF